jgi:hypothetical protein
MRGVINKSSDFNRFNYFCGSGFFSSISMEMILSTMSDLLPLFDKVSFPMSIVLLEDLNSLGRTFRSGLDLFSWLPRGGLSSLHLSRMLHPRQYLFVLSALQRC